MNIVALSMGNVKLHSGAIMEKSHADAITAWIQDIYLVNPDAYWKLLIAHGRREALTDAAALELIRRAEPRVQLLDSDGKLTGGACMVIHAMLAISITGEPQRPYPEY